jgi:hypothetical protein
VYSWGIHRSGRTQLKTRLPQERTLPCSDGAIRIQIDTTTTHYTLFIVTGTHRAEIGQITSSHLTRSRPFDSIVIGTQVPNLRYMLEARRTSPPSLRRSLATYRGQEGGLGHRRTFIIAIIHMSDE